MPGPLGTFSGSIERLRHLHAWEKPVTMKVAPSPQDRQLEAARWVKISYNKETLLWTVALRPCALQKDGQLKAIELCEMCDLCEGYGEVRAKRGDFSVTCPQCKGHCDVTDAQRRAYQEKKHPTRKGASCLD